MTFIQNNDEVHQFHPTGPTHTIHQEMSQDLPQLFDLTPEKALAYLFDRLLAGTAVIDRHFRLRRCNPTWVNFIKRHTASSAADQRARL